MYETTKKSHYVNGKEFYEELKIYHSAYLESVSKGEPKPPITNKMAEAITQIATRMATSHNFSGYSYIQDMISDAVFKCIDKAHRFDPSVSEQSFGWFSQVIWNAFINRIKIEQHQSSVKARIIRNSLSSEFVEHGVDSAGEDDSNTFVEFLVQNDAYIDYYEQRKENAEKNKDSSATKHRNRTPYVKKEVIVPIKEKEVCLEDFT